jgi:hypothetical protein
VDRKWVFAGVAGLLVLFAVLALVVGGVVGRSIVPKPAEPSHPPTVRFADTLTDVAISYPATWVRRQPHDQRVRIVVASPDGSAGARVSVRPSGLEEPVTVQNLPVVRKLLIDALLQADRNIVTPIPEPVVVTVGGLPGYKYTYVFRRADGTDGANVHYFLFKDARLVQMVLQAVPASRLKALEPTFQQIADTFEGNRR